MNSSCISYPYLFKVKNGKLYVTKYKRIKNEIIIIWEKSFRLEGDKK
jgi:hypothetical protein